MNKLMKLNLEEKNKSDNVESYTAMMSHEFRTPLSVTLMFLENIMNKIVDQDVL